MYYNQLLGKLFQGSRVRAVETVEYVRYPGNAYDRQYAKFCQPFGAVTEDLTDEQQFRLCLADVVFEHQVRRLKPDKP